MTKSKAVRNRTSGLQQFILAGRPTAAQFKKVYGPKGPSMTWAEREAAGISAADFQQAIISGTKSKRAKKQDAK